MDNKLSIHFRKEEAKSMLFASKHKMENGKKINIKYEDQITF